MEASLAILTFAVVVGSLQEQLFDDIEVRLLTSQEKSGISLG